MPYLVQHGCNNYQLMKEGIENPNTCGIESDFSLLEDEVIISHDIFDTLDRLTRRRIPGVNLANFIISLPENKLKKDIERLLTDNREAFKKLGNLLVRWKKLLSLDLKDIPIKEFEEILVKTNEIFPVSIPFAITGWRFDWQRIVRDTCDIWGRRPVTYFVNVLDLDKICFPRDQLGVNTEINTVDFSQLLTRKRWMGAELRMLHVVNDERTLAIARRYNPTHLITDYPNRIVQLLKKDKTGL